MKKIILLLWLIFSFSTTTQAQDNYEYSYEDYSYKYGENWEIDALNSEIFINQDGKIEITETILADFTNEAHRGIERSIPYEYSNDYNSRISFIKAENEKGENWATNIFREYGYLYIQMTTKDDSKIAWPATFKLKYIAENVVSFFDTHDEFYWNVNGTDWVVPTKKVDAKIHLPKEFEPDQLNFACYTGVYNSSETSCSWLIEDKKTISFKTNRPLDVNEGLTIVLGMPKGTIEKPSPLKKAWWYLQDNPFVPIAPLALIFMIILWFKYGRDDQNVKDTVVPSFTPPKNLTPTEVGTIIDETIHPRDITATIIYFAIKGFIKIKELEDDDFELELTKPYTTNKDFEEKVLSAIFSKNKKGEKKKISSLKNNFYTNIDGIKKSVINDLIKEGYFKENPEDTRAMYYGIGGTIFFLSVFTAGFISGAGMMSIMTSGIIVMLFGIIMPRKTTKGTETYYQLEGLYEYIDTAEKDRMKFQEDNKILFEKLLPYAMAFGLVKKWTKAFEGIYKNPPGWYSSTTPWSNRPFTMMYLSDHLNSFGKSTTSNIVSRPGGNGGSGSWSGGSGFSSGGFGGGGFSGGGFGGGGGRGL